MQKLNEQFRTVAGRGHAFYDKSLNDKVKKIRIYLEDETFKMNYQNAIKHQGNPTKCAANSNTYCEEGNQHYAAGKFIRALECFNMSICFAPEHSEQLAKGYASRSAVYFSMKMFELSLKNIEMARNVGCPKSLAPQLDDREAKCVSELKKLETSPKNEFQGLKPELSYPPHEKVPFIANCLDLKVNEKYGRHIVTKSDLKVGDVVAIEQPFCAAISSKFRYWFCANCFRENDLDLVPCPNCHSVMFCSPECLAAANEAFHAIECPITDVLFCSDALNDRAYITFRLLIVAMKNFKSSGELMKFIENLENREQNIFNVNYKQTRDIDMFASILNLSRYEQDDMINENIRYSVMLLKILLNLTSFKERFKSEHEIDFIAGLIYRLCELMISNGVPGSCTVEMEPEIEQPTTSDNISCVAVYPFFVLLNHSCAPNVHFVQHGTQLVMIVMKPIKSGEQLCKCYGKHHNDVDRETRQDQLRKSHEFTCDCLACVKNYRMLSESDWRQHHDFIMPIEHAQLCEDYKINVVKELIPKYSEFLKENSEVFPENHTNIAEALLKDFFELLYINEIPLAHKPKLKK